MFNLIFKTKTDKDRLVHNQRTAVRAVMMRDDGKVLLLRTDRGDYYVPGGFASY